MITTEQAILDPVEFLSADLDLVARLPVGPGEVISGSDIDMLVTVAHSFTGVRPSRSIQRTSPVLGDLYQYGAIDSEVIASRVIHIDWFPSPEHVNDTMEEIGLIPGVDFLRFVHSYSVSGELEQIPLSEYGRHLANGEYPQTTSSYNFSHDRDDSHALGVLYLPKNVTGRIIELAFQNTTSNNWWKRHQNKSMLGGFENATTLIKIIAHQLWEDKQSGAPVVDPSIFPTHPDIPADFFGLDRITNKNMAVKMRVIVEEILEQVMRIDELIERTTSS